MIKHDGLIGIKVILSQIFQNLAKTHRKKAENNTVERKQNNFKL
jgi:hypothetical protein